MLPPIAIWFSVILFFIFLLTLFSCCYREYKKSKEPVPPPLLPKRTSSMANRRYITTIDVQTGLPVVVDTSAIAAHHSQVRIVPPSQWNHSINTPADYSTLYGSVHSQPLKAGNPPPAYSEVYPPQRIP